MGGKERKMEGKWLEETRERVEEEWKRRRQRLSWRRGGRQAEGKSRGRDRKMKDGGLAFTQTPRGPSADCVFIRG